MPRAQLPKRLAKVTAPIRRYDPADWPAHIARAAELGSDKFYCEQHNIGYRRFKEIKRMLKAAPDQPIINMRGRGGRRLSNSAEKEGAARMEREFTDKWVATDDNTLATCVIITHNIKYPDNPIVSL